MDKRCSSVMVWGEEIVATDDPRWIDCERAVKLAFNTQDDAAVELVGVRPRTLAGITALLRYAVEANIDGQGWSVELDDGKTLRPWHHFLVKALLPRSRTAPDYAVLL